MDSRERTFIALEHQEPDRVPMDCWVSSGTKQKIESQFKIPFNDFLDLYDVDLRYIEGPQYIGPAMKSGSEVETDIWGVPRKPVRCSLNDSMGICTETYKEVIESPLQKFSMGEEINNYPYWPSADWFDYSDIERQCNEILKKGRVVVFMGDRLNRFAQLKPAMYLRGFEQILPGGGYIACTSHNIQADTSIENIKALFNAYHKYGKYVGN